MKRLSAFLLIAVLALAGCAGARTFDQSLRALEGHPVNDVALALGGPPAGQYQDGPAIVYVWKDSLRESVFGPAVTRGRGYKLGRSMNNKAALMWSGIEHHSCVVRATTMGGIVQRVTLEGNPGGCETIHGYRKEPLGRNISQ